MQFFTLLPYLMLDTGCHRDEYLHEEAGHGVLDVLLLHLKEVGPALLVQIFSLNKLQATRCPIILARSR